jgi:hypothetical protein
MPTARIFFAALMSASKSDPQLAQTKRKRLMWLSARLDPALKGRVCGAQEDQEPDLEP